MVIWLSRDCLGFRASGGVFTAVCLIVGDAGCWREGYRFCVIFYKECHGQQTCICPKHCIWCCVWCGVVVGAMVAGGNGCWRNGCGFHIYSKLQHQVSLHPTIANKSPKTSMHLWMTPGYPISKQMIKPWIKLSTEHNQTSISGMTYYNHLADYLTPQNASGNYTPGISCHLAKHTWHTQSTHCN